MDNRDLLKETYAVLEAAIAAHGAERYLLIDRALELWRAAHGEAPAPEPVAPPMARVAGRR